MRFYAIDALDALDAQGRGLVALDAGGQRLWRYAPVTQLWHRHEGNVMPALLCQAQGPRRRLGAVEVAQGDAWEIARDLPRPRENTRAGHQVAEQARAEVRSGRGVITSAEIGLTVQMMRGARPTTTAGLVDLLIARQGRSMITRVARFGEGASHSGPFSMVKSIQKMPRFGGNQRVWREVDPMNGDAIVSMCLPGDDSERVMLGDQIERDPVS